MEHHCLHLNRLTCKRELLRVTEIVMSKEISRSFKNFCLWTSDRLSFRPIELVTLSVQFHLYGSHSQKNLPMLYVPATLRSEVNWEGAYCAHTEIRLKTVTWYTVEPVLSGTGTLWWPLNIGLTVWRNKVFHFCLLFVVFLKNVGILVNYKIIHKIKNETTLHLHLYEHPYVLVQSLREHFVMFDGL